MKNHWLWALLALMVASLSCNLPTQQTTWTNVTSVVVTPSSGEKDFSLEVKYNYTWYRDQPIAEIYCMYTTPSGSTIPIGTIVPTGLDRDREAFSKADKLAFSIKPKDEKIEPGLYIAGCATEHEGSLVTTQFTVTESATPTVAPETMATATPTVAPETMATATLPVEPTKQLTITPAPITGKIIFDYAQTDSSRPGAGGELKNITELCIADVTISPDGVVGGTCEFYGTGFVREATVTVHVTGIAVQGGSFNFTYDVTEKGSNGWNLKPGENPSVPVWSNEAKWEISYAGSGSFTSATQASGTATFNFSCDSGADNLLWCNSQPREAFSGTITWRFDPSQ